jgi:hypothetical protein
MYITKGEPQKALIKIPKEAEGMAQMVEYLPSENEV